MKQEIMKKSEIYKVFNDITLKNEIIIFGSAFAANFPFYELAKKYLLSNAIYNRSIEGLTISEAVEILDDCVLKPKPSKIFFALGEHDTKTEETITAYEMVIQKTKEVLPTAEIYIMSTKSDDSGFNASLDCLCNKTGAVFVNIDYNKSANSIFKQLAPFLRSEKLTFADAFCVG